MQYKTVSLHVIFLAIGLFFLGCGGGTTFTQEEVTSTEKNSTTTQGNTAQGNTADTTKTTSTQDGNQNSGKGGEQEAAQDETTTNQTGADSSDTQLNPDVNGSDAEEVPEGNSTAVLAVLDINDIVEYKAKGLNLIQNGSFELGLGSEPIYVGWRQREYNASMKAPALPTIDKTTAATGTNSLKVENIEKNQVITVDFTPPNIGDKSRIYFGVSAKSSCEKLVLHFPSTDKYLTDKWERFNSYSDVVHKEYVVKRFEIYNNGDTPCTLWLDDITWTLEDNTQNGWVKKDSIEAVFIPYRRNGVTYDNEDLLLKFNIDSDNDKQNLALEVHVRDLTRDGEESLVFVDDLELEKGGVYSKTINLKHFTRGAYMAHLAIYDKATHTILTTAKERFSVMADLQNKPAPVGFLAGMHGGFHAFTHSREFSYRGAWDVDEYYKNAYTIGLRAQRIFAGASELEPQKDNYDLSILQPTINYAAKHGCTTVLTIDPFRNIPKDSEKPTGHDGDWIFQDGVDVSARANSSLYDIFTLPAEHMAVLFGKIGEEFGDKLIALENTNELNMYYHPDNMKEAVEDLFKPMYSSFKKYAPNVPVMVDFTMDFYGVNYTDRFFQNGGGEYADGFTYHPYGRAWVYRHDGYGDHYGIDFIKRNETFRTNNSTESKKLVMGMSELHAEGVYSAVGFDIMQRTLLDWSGGALFSSGMLSAGMYFLETRTAGEWNNKSTTAPGVGAVALNAMYDILAGYKLLKRVDNDHGVLSVVFENETTNMFALALAQGDFVDKRAVLEANIPEDAIFYDQWGKKIEKKGELKLSNEILYIVSKENLLNVVEDATIRWSDEPNGYDYDKYQPLPQFSPAPNDAWYARLLKTGIRPREKRTK